MQDPNETELMGDAFAEPVVAEGAGEAPFISGADPVTGEPLPNSRVSIADRVFDPPTINSVRAERGLALVPNPEPEVDPLVRDGIIAAPTIDPPAASAPEQAKRTVHVWSSTDITGRLNTALMSGSPKRRDAAIRSFAFQVANLQEAIAVFARQAEIARAAFMKLAEYVGPEAVEDALKSEPVAEAPAEVES
jgi:hypothetical protein